MVLSSDFEQRLRAHSGFEASASGTLDPAHLKGVLVKGVLGFDEDLVGPNHLVGPHNLVDIFGRTESIGRTKYFSYVVILRT